MAKRTLVTLHATGGGECVSMRPEETKELISLGLKVRMLRNDFLSNLVPLTPENRAILEKAGFTFRSPHR